MDQDQAFQTKTKTGLTCPLSLKVWTAERTAVAFVGATFSCCSLPRHQGNPSEMGCSQSEPSKLSKEDSSLNEPGKGFSIPSRRTREAILDAHPVEKWFESSPDYQYVDELDAYQDSKGRTLRKLAPSAAAEQFFWNVPLVIPLIPRFSPIGH